MVMQEIGSFIAVLVVAVGVAAVIGTLYATGLRLWAKSEPQGEGGSVNAGARAGSITCYAVCVAIVLFALWLMIPLFH